jgi:hypothetical protein
MLLVPRQLQRAGMTGDVPYYGGRLTPWHVNAITHQARRPAPPPPRDPRQVAATLEALLHLQESGVINQQEYDALRARILA